MGDHPRGRRLRGLAGLLRGGVWVQNGDAAQAAVHFARSQELLESVGMNIYAYAAMRMRGLNLKGSSGEALVASSDQFFTKRGVKRPAAFVRALLPGFP